jgi:site-specific recombinase XerD
MNTNLTFSISFFIRTDRIDGASTAPLFLRVTVNGERADFTTNRRISIHKWKDGKPVGSTEDVKNIREYMESLRSRIYNIQKDLKDHNEAVSIDNVRDRFYEKQKKVKDSKMLKEVFEFHNDQIKALVGKDYSKETLKRYNTAKKHVFEYLEKKYNLQDIELKKLNYEFITGLENFLKIERNCNHNSTMKYIKNFKTVVNMAVKYEWLDRDPFSKFSCKTLPVERGFLTPDELKTIEDAEINIPRIEQIRDVFVFCCYTGLAHVDVLKLKKENMYKGIDGSQWININRTKTDTNSRIPLLSKAASIIEKYINHPVVLAGSGLLPTSSNQKTNAYLKEVATKCGITKNLTFHLARHTFATTVTLTNGVPIETVSFMLGHKNLRTTQIYSKVVELKVSDDMKMLKKKLSKRDKKKA